MDCLTFTKWLENRDMYDVSEADKALKHSVQCGECQRVLSLDEQLDNLLFKAMKPDDLPDSLKSRIDLNLDRVSVKPQNKKYGWYAAIPAAMAALFIFFFSFPSSSDLMSMDELGKSVVADHSVHDDSVLVVSTIKEITALGLDYVEYDAVMKGLPKGYEFVGARICPLGECEAIHMVYTDKGKRISLYIVKAGDVGFKLSADREYSMTMGQQVVKFWKNGGHIFAMTS